MTSKRFQLNRLISNCLFYSNIIIVSFAALLVLANAILFNQAATYRFVMLPDSALGLLAAILILIGAVANKRYLVFSGMLAVAMLIGAGLFWHLPDAFIDNIGWLSGQNRLPLWQCLGLLLLCAPWLGWSNRPMVSGISLALLVRLVANVGLLGLSLTVLISQTLLITDLFYSPSLSASTYTALYLMLLAVGSICLPYVKWPGVNPFLPRNGWLLVGFIALSSTLLWFNYAHQLQSRISQSATELADRLQHSLDQIVAEQRALMYRQAERIAVADSTLAKTYLNVEFQSYLRDYPYIDYLAVAGDDGLIQYAKAQRQDELPWFNQYLVRQNIGRIAPQTDDFSEPELTLHYDGFVDHVFICIRFPTGNDAGVKQLVASVDTASTLKKILADIVPQGYFVRLVQPEQQITIYDSATSVADITAIGFFDINFMTELNWELRVFTNLKTGLTSSLVTAEVILIAGWFTTLLVMLSQKLYQQSQRHRIRLLATNDKLRHNITELKRLQLQQQQIMSNSADMICVIDAKGHFVKVSASCQQILGYLPDELVGEPFIDFVHPDDKVMTEDEAAQIIVSGKLTDNFRNRYVCKDGGVVHIMWVANYVPSQGLLYAIGRNFNDIVKAEQYEADQQSILSMISTEQPLPGILNQICLMAEQQSSAVRASIMLKQGDYLNLAAAPSLSDTYKSTAKNVPVTDNVGPCGAAAYHKKLVVAQSLETDIRWHDYAPAALAEGILACWSIPMLSLQQEVLGTIALCCSEVRAATKDELELMTTCSRFAALAIERATQKRKLQQSEQRYRSLFHHNPEPVYVIKPDGCFADMNEAGCHLLQHSLVTLTGMHYSQIILPADLLRVQQHFANVLGGNPQRFEACIVTRQGQQLELYISIVPTWEDGKVTGVIGISKDITQQLKAEQQLRLFKRAVDATSNGIVIADLHQDDQPVVYVNPAFEKLTGYNFDEIIGQNCRMLQGAEPDNTVNTLIRRAIAGQQECSVVMKNYRKDNSLFWNKLFLAPVPDESGEISHYVGVQTDITAHKRFEQELAYNASHDLLTGLPNRALLKDRLYQSCQQVLRRQQKIAILFIDLDGFKLINDSLGHLAGDEVLNQMALRIKSCIRPGDTLARIGGDEFVLLLTELEDVPEIESVAERILEIVATPLELGNQELHMSASIGISIPDDNLVEPMHLVQQADLAMYRAKQQGRNNYQWYNSELENASGKQLNLRAQLRKAIANNEFELYYQPQIDAISGDVVGLEALLRWPHPELGFISPDEFIPLAENIGEIVPLSNWVMQQASQYNQSLIDRGIACVVMAVNVSSIQFARVNFVEHLKETIQQSGLDSRWFEIELTESVLLENTEQVITKLQQLRELGVKISIDDFGTGYSSLSYLKRLPIDKLKIDRSFIQDIVSDKRDAAISKAIISLAHHLNIKVIAEGVENEAQAALLRKNLCDEYQGYYFGRPMPADKLEHYLQNYQQNRIIRPAIIDDARTILLVDDEENILSALTRSLRREGYHILSCTSAMQAFEVLALNQVQVIVSDQRMPGMSGTEFLSQVKDMYPDTIRIVLSGYTDLKSVTEAINKGAIYKFMTKPWQEDELRQEIKKAFVQYQQQQTAKTGEL
ncbi:PAS domain S-box-containing protein/diguanylate cyclase (GGDEF) domain-containing protein [Arsukibacterium tuosuense]|uniref:cyclic-guanylate-specific phosphodiesterase n=1 Tax=Arsukibacterium tuosuense TaxID=1323745 RepID=A0A285ITQ6_9GAMM|nr:EAL domain-containing protein [Arsukibacterium tuosuense]SNY51415.1 PAS domain S-box-containing protein/diguanylate cyclase (GGDEF) domain-containing protein [Arsukibacterium tuosuense]